IGNAEAIVKTVEAGFGVSLISSLAASWALDCKTIIKVPISGVDFRRKAYMVRKKLKIPNRVVGTFWGFVHHPGNTDLLSLAET
ncbi:unnamed protein product, partial [marine sediment metagenome]